MAVNNPPTPTPIGGAIERAIDGNEPVMVGASLAILVDALIGFALYKTWLLPEDMALLTPIIVAAIGLGAVVVRQKVYSKASAAELLETDPNGPLSQGEVKLLAAAK
jgi:hypothetical protein